MLICPMIGSVFSDNVALRLLSGAFISICYSVWAKAPFILPVDLIIKMTVMFIPPPDTCKHRHGQQIIHICGTNNVEMHDTQELQMWCDG